MKSILELLFIVFSTAIGNAQVVQPLKYQSMYQPMTQEQMEAVAQSRALEAKRREAMFNEYKNKAVYYGKINDHEGCIYYGEAAQKMGFVSSDLLYWQGRSYYILGKKSKYKKSIKKANKFNYFETVRLLKALEK